MVQQKNIKKRSTSVSEPNAKKTKVSENANVVAQKKKVENGAVQNGQANKQVKKNVPNKPKNEMKNDKPIVAQNPKKKEANAASQDKNKKSGASQGEAKGPLAQKRQEYREKRKVKRQDKNHGLAPDLTIDQIKKKIQLIESRKDITKTAKRKLAALRKKLRVEEGMDKKTHVVKKSVEKQKNEKAVESKGKQQVQKNEPKRQPQGKAQAKANQDNKKKQEDALVAKQKKEEEEEEDDEDEEEELSEEEDESDVELDEEEDEDDDEEDDDEDDDDDEEEEDDDEDEEEEVEKDEQNKTSKAKPNMVQSQQEKGKPKNAEADGKKKRYVLFVGNLPYTITNEELKKHFLTKVSQVVDVRIPKKDANTARGFAYVELANSTDYEKALALNHTFISGRRINVQYSGDNKKVGVQKNFKLQALQKAGKLAGGKNKFNQRNPGHKGKQNVQTTKT